VQLDWASFTPGAALAGGALIGLAAVAFALLVGRIAGVSGIVAGLLHPRRADMGWRAAFVAGLLGAPWLYALARPLPAAEIDAGAPLLVAAGLLVGLGTRYGAGCTSGHGVCGLSRFSPRSAAATVLFMAAGFATVFVVRHLLA